MPQLTTFPVIIVADGDDPFITICENANELSVYVDEFRDDLKPVEEAWDATSRRVGLLAAAEALKRGDAPEYLSEDEPHPAHLAPLLRRAAHLAGIAVERSMTPIELARALERRPTSRTTGRGFRRMRFALIGGVATAVAGALEALVSAIGAPEYWTVVGRHYGQLGLPLLPLGFVVGYLVSLRRERDGG